MPNASEFLGGQQAAGAAPSGGGSGMASPTQDLSELLYRGQNVLGKGTEVSLPGTVSQPLSAGIASTPTPGSVPGAAPGAEGGGGMGMGGGEAGGPTLLQQIMQALGIAEKTGSLASRLGGQRGEGMPTQGAPGPVITAPAGAESLSNLQSSTAGAGIQGPEGAPLLSQLQQHYGESIEISYVSREPGQIVLDFKRI